MSIDTGALRIDFRRSFDVLPARSTPAVITRCQVKAGEGWHDVLRGDGPVVYMHLYAGMADVRIFHTFVFDQDPRRVELSSIGLDLPLALAEPLRAAAGSDGAAAHWCEHWETLAVLQDGDRRYTVTTWLRYRSRLHT